MEAKILVVTQHDNYVAEDVKHFLSSLGKGIEGDLIEVAQLDKLGHGKWDYAIVLNHCIDINAPQ